MRVRDDSLLRVSFALRDPKTAAAAVRELAGNCDPIAVEGLLELVEASPSSRLVVSALEALEPTGHPLFREAVRLAFASSHAPVRLAAVLAVQRGNFDEFDGELKHVIRTDESWPNRRAAVQTLAERAPAKWAILAAADDPHWRVRHALIRVLQSWEAERTEILSVLRRAGRGFASPAGPEIDQRPDSEPFRVAAGLAPLGPPYEADVRSHGIAAYLEWAWTGTEPPPISPPDPAAMCPFWDWDPAVLAVKLQRFGKTGREAEIDAMPFLAGHSDERVWKLAVAAIREHGEPRHFAAALGFLGDPRIGTEARTRLLDGLAEEFVEQFDSPRAPLRVAAKRGSFARAAALTPERAAELVADPHRETSWFVLDRACRLAKVPLWTIEPETAWNPTPVPASPKSAIAVSPTLSPHLAYLGAERLPVSRIGISGHYLLPPEGFAVAAEAGVNWFFWEPNYDTLTDFSTRISPTVRREFHFVAGTFEADGAKITRDAERALRMLKVDRLGLFLVFWVQSWDRLTDNVRDAVAKLKRDGKAAVVGLSTHNRPLAIRAMAEGWNPVMVRHSAGHRGAETLVFPKAAEFGTTLLTFNNLCYGRMLKPIAGLPAPDPADCYRYTLSFPAVSACWSAPATLEQLAANLRALREPTLSPERRAELIRFGDALYREESVFRRLVREL